MTQRSHFCGFACAALLAAVPAAQAQNYASGLAVDLPEPNSAALGFAARVERSPYVGDGSRFDVLPLYIYDGKHLFLDANRVGLKLLDEPAQRLDLVVERRLEGFPLTQAPASLTGMAVRDASVDVGVSYSIRQPWGQLKAEVVHDSNSTHRGTEARLGYAKDWRSGALTWRPSLSVAWRNAKLNDYYYGVRASEATATRAAYEPGAGLEARVGLHATYEVSRHWSLLTGVSATVLGNGVNNSPIVEQRVLPSYYLGAVYNFGPHDREWVGTSSPTYFKLLYGKATADGCHLLKIITAQCLSTASVNPTSISAVQIGRPFIQNFNGLPIDVVGYVGLTQHNDSGLQPNGLQVDLFMKAFYTGFPWQDRIKTRAGLGMGVSMAQRVPYQEVSSQAANGEQTSRLLHHLDPSLDVSLGDLIGSRPLKDTYIGFGVSHRSGIFKSSRLLGNVNGGSNYIYTYVETVY
ncbi:MAG: MipA/OmpV family protein [Polaromonas sp.]|nr:MipA/OmpV family protein [Polaromonas sp.]